MQCIHCGYQLSAFDNICPRCSKSQTTAPTPPAAPVHAPPPPPVQSQFTPPPQPRRYGAPPTPTIDDGPNTSYALLGFLIPIVGFILYFVTKGNQPMKAGSALKGALWGFFLPFVIVMGLVALGSRTSNTFKTANGQTIVQPDTSAPVDSSAAANSSAPSTEQVVALRQQTERDLVPTLTTEAQKVAPGSSCTSVTLVEASTSGQFPQLYTGIATFSNGEKLNINVTLGQDGIIIWQNAARTSP